MRGEGKQQFVIASNFCRRFLSGRRESLFKVASSFATFANAFWSDPSRPKDLVETP